jgi:6-phosphogluconolactonase
MERAEVARAAGRTLEVVLGGGSTPGPVYRALASLPLRDLRVRLWPGDERVVMATDAARNGLLIHRCFEGAAWRPAPELRPWPEEAGDPASARYALELSGALGARPVFDLALLGIGGDGHTAGLFPGDSASEEALASVALAGNGQAGNGQASPPLALATLAPTEPRLRMTLAPAVLGGAARLVFLSRGRAKEAVLAELLGPRGAGMVARRVAALAADEAEILHCEPE